MPSKMRAQRPFSVWFGPHQVEIEVRLQAEQLERRVEEAAVLSRRAQGNRERLWLLPQPEDDGGHFDGLRTGSHHSEHATRQSTLRTTQVRP